MNNLQEMFNEVWNEELSKKTPQEQEFIRNLNPQKVAFTTILVLLNPLTWIKIILTVFNK